ncbi:IDEAL domain-containing protein [Lentibacillus juripiscarius]|uniref:IDEAL domain-containing protein n=1 Tax=Lentibacillus juripiscarius TaxID=257446 RepID=A0ABW5V7Q2_9BACI
MNRQKASYRFYRYTGKTLYAKREISYELRLTAQLVLDELCFNWNKQKLEMAINHSVDTGDKEQFLLLSEAYRSYIWE